MGFKFRRLLAIAVAAWFLIPLSSHAVQAQSKKPYSPYSKEEVLKGLNIIVDPKLAKLEERKDAAKRLSDLVQQRRVNFDLTKEDEEDLRAVGRKGEDPELIEIISKLIETIRNSYQPHTAEANKSYNQGRESEISGHYEDAVKAYKDAIQHDLRSHEAYRRLGVVHHQLGQDEEAKGAFKNAIRLKPDYIEAYYSLASLHNEAGHYEEAIALLKTAVESTPTAAALNPTYADAADAHFLLGAIYGNLGSYKEAIEPFKKAIEYGTSQLADAHYYLSISYFKSKMMKEALEQCDLLRAINKERADKLYDVIKPIDKL